ncbi:MAG: hypothetical protein ACYC3O_04835 [Burkholderiales bacterium]
MNTWKDPFGSNRLGLWLADRSDRKHDRISRIAARWGWLTPLGDRGKVIWVMAGADRNSVRLAIELTRAIREKRLDVRLILTYEQEYPDLLALLDDCDKTGWGLAPSDHPRALARAMERLAPYGIIVVSTHPRPHLSELLAMQKRVLAVNPSRTVDFSCERVYNDPAGNGSTADMQAILAQAQVDPNFKSLVNQGKERHLWWLHGATAEAGSALTDQLFAEYPDDIVFVSGLRPLKDSLAISAWDRSPIATGRVVWIDDEKWLPAISAAVTATHFARVDPVILWQAMAGGAAVSCADYAELPKTGLRTALAACANPLPLWQNYRANPILTRQAGDNARRLFWQERRQAEMESRELVTRVFEW